MPAVEAQSHRVTWFRSDRGRSRKSSNTLSTAQGSANSTFAVNFFSIFIDLQSLILPILAFLTPDCKALAFRVSLRRGDALPLYMGKQLVTLAIQPFMYREMTLYLSLVLFLMIPDILLSVLNTTALKADHFTVPRSAVTL